MNVETIGERIFNNKKGHIQNFNGLYNSRYLKKGLEMASNNGVLFSSVACVTLSSIVRPIAVLMTPNAKKEDKQYTCARSITSGILGFGITMAITTPIIKAVDNITKNTDKFLKPETIKFFKGKNKALVDNKGAYGFVGQMIKLSSSFLTAESKAYFACALIPPVMSFLFNKEKNPNNKYPNKNEKEKIAFKGHLGQNLIDKFSKQLAKLYDWKPMQKVSLKYHDTNFAQHLFSLNDIYLTALFVKYTSKNKNIKEERKKTLNYNAILQTGLTIPASYVINKFFDIPTKKFIEKLKAANPCDEKINKYIEGVKIAKPVLIMGTLYYIVAPVACTMMADFMAKKFDKENYNK